MKYAEIKRHDIANGPGVRVSLFVSGCSIHCECCFNKVAWDFDYGQEFTEETQAGLLGDLEPYYIHGLTLLGGEPMEPQNQEALLPFVKKVKERYPEKTIWCFSGYYYEEMLIDSPLMPYIDVLVDGPFVQEKKSIRLLFRGSENQRLIDVKKSREQGKTILWEEKK